MTSLAPPPGLLPAPWPHGDGRPWTASTAVWSTVATAGCAALGAAIGVESLVAGDGTADRWLLLLAPASALALGGARALAERRGRVVALVGLAGVAAVLLVAGIVNTEMRKSGVGLPMWTAVCLGPPLVSAAFALAPSVGDWLAGRRPAAPLPYAPPPPGWPADRWPHGEPRPDAATTAAVLGILTGVPATVLGWLSAAALLGGLSEASGGWTALPVGVALLAGARRLHAGRDRRLLVLAAAAAVLLVLVVAVPTAPDPGVVLLALGFLLPLPATTLVLALRRPVGAWVAGR